MKIKAALSLAITIIGMAIISNAKVTPGTLIIAGAVIFVFSMLILSAIQEARSHG